jgi:alkaline phosphatase D
LAAGTEFAVSSVTSPGVESRAPHDTAAYARAMVAHNRQLHWAETSRRGYLTLELTPARATGTWHLLETVREPSLALASTRSLAVAHGSRRFAA